MRNRNLLVSFILALSALLSTLAQSLAPAATPIATTAATLAKDTAVRDAFVARIHANGFSCPIPVPTILVEDVPSFGQYDDKTNITLIWVDKRFIFARTGQWPGDAEEHGWALPLQLSGM